MSRSSVDLPQPDGPMSETNSPRLDRQVDPIERRRPPPSPVPKTLPTPGDLDDRRVAAVAGRLVERHSMPATGR